MHPLLLPPQPDPVATEPERKLSSLEMLLLGLSKPPEAEGPPLHSGSVCPECGLGRLDYNGLLQLECARCSFVSGEGAGCT